MNPSPEEVLFALALTKPAEKRAAFLDAMCEDDAALHQRLEALLAAHEQPDAALATAAPVGKQTIKLDLTSEPADEAVGQMLGRYKLLERVGEGGCGVVYVAEQTEPVRRRVALKVIKLGMDTKQVVARFEAERQALAMMDHPNIAKVLDAGTTELGRPYFVMELVRGIRITDYCDQANLSTKERLDLFIKVCQAIQHAHQKGIIHRDIKPSNILVTLHDGVPVPKVIDFGIAKATEGRLTDATVYTQLHQFIGTPAYMSPEQAEMSGLDIDTRSDIYSLGVLLYELLAGSTPFDGQELMSQGIDAMRKTIREKEPVRPSTKLATLKGDDLTTTAKRRSVETSKLANLLRGDLDWIVMKCLEKDRTRRYDTANGLAFDLKRHLSNEPVLARPPSAAYKFQKAFRRNKLAFAAGAAVIVALVAGLSLAALGWRQTRAERDKAIQARASEEAQRKGAQASEQKAITAEVAQIRLREQAEVQTLAARRSAYNSDMNQVQQLLRVNNLSAAQRLLDRQRPSQDQADLRGWEWRYLWSQTRADDHEVFIAATNKAINSLTFNADGRLLARKRDGERFTVTDMKSRRVVFQPPNAYLPAFAHHDNRLAFIHRRDASNDVIRIVDVDKVRPNLSAQHESRIEMPWNTTVRLAFAADDRRLFTVSTQPDEGSSDEPPYSLTAWDVDTSRQLWQRRIHYSGKSGNRRPLDISPDGTAIAFLRNGRLEVVETEDGRTRFVTKIAGECYYTVTFSPDGATVVSGAGLSAIHLWDARSGEPAGSLEGHNAWVNDLQFSADGEWLISSSEDQTIRVWDWSSRKPMSVFRSPPGVYGLTPSVGHTLASRTSDHSIWLWDLTKPPLNLGYQTLSNSIVRVVFTPDSQSILGTGGDSGVALWDARTLKEMRRLSGTTRQGSFLSPDAKWVLRSDGELWDVKSWLTTSNFVTGLGTLATRPRFTANGKFLVIRSGSDSNSVLVVWDTATWKRKDSRSFEFKRIANWPGGFTPALTNSYALMADGAVHLFDVTKLSELPKKFPCPNGIFGLATSPDGRLAVGAFKGGSVLFWDVETSKLLESRRAFLLDARSVAFSPDGQRLAVSSTGLEAVKFWDVETRQELLTLSGEGELDQLTFSPDGRHLLGINDVGRLHLWSAPTMEEINAAETKENAVVKQP